MSFQDHHGIQTVIRSVEEELADADRVDLKRFLTDGCGIGNRDDAIDVVADREPQLQIVSPTASRVYTVPGGALSVRVRAEDDFGRCGSKLTPIF